MVIYLFCAELILRKHCPRLLNDLKCLVSYLGHSGYITYNIFYYQVEACTPVDQYYKIRTEHKQWVQRCYTLAEIIQLAVSIIQYLAIKRYMDSRRQLCSNAEISNEQLKQSHIQSANILT